MPRVAGANDFRSEFSVRGSPYRQIGVVIDGVATPWLQHTVYGRRDAGSLSMFGSDLVDGLTLQVGAYPRRYEDALGAELQVTFREGSRDSTSFTARAGGTSSGFTGEGPIGTRGSWLAGVRNSFRAWPPRPLTQNDVGFAFADLHAKLVYDVSPTQQISMTAVGGRSTVDTVDEPLVGPLGDGRDRSGLLTIGWRSAFGSRMVLRQRIAVIGQELVTTLPAGRLAGRARNRALSYRAEIQRALGGGLLDAGAEYSGILGAREKAVQDDDTGRATSSSDVGDPRRLSQLCPCDRSKCHAGDWRTGERLHAPAPTCCSPLDPRDLAVETNLERLCIRRTITSIFNYRRHRESEWNVGARSGARHASRRWHRAPILEVRVASDAFQPLGESRVAPNGPATAARRGRHTRSDARWSVSKFAEWIFSRHRTYRQDGRAWTVVRMVVRPPAP